MLREKIQKTIDSGPRTLLCVGPVSVNCVDAVIDLAKDYHFPLTLIASRRQVEASALGGGYVGSWSTVDYVEYVRQRDPEGKVILGRDHSGPWQNEDSRLSLDEAMASAKKSLTVDIEAGLQFIHLDPSLDPQGTPSVEEILKRMFELHGFCSEQANSKGKEIEFEFGPFSSEILDELPMIEFALERVTEHCRKNKFKLPLYLVVNTGTKVMETRNVGCFDPMISSSPNGVLRGKIKSFVSVCERHQVFLKEHNTDYLSKQALLEHPALGIHCANIAPELGVIETVELLNLIKKVGRQDLYEEFVSLAVDSQKWQKWMLPETVSPSHEYLGRISGHYVYSHPQGMKIREQVGLLLKEQGVDMEAHLKACIRSRVEYYLKCFSLI